VEEPTEEAMIEAPAPVITPVPVVVPAPGPRTLGDDHSSLTHRFKAGSVEGIFIVGLFDDGAPGEALFVPRTASPAATATLGALTDALNLALPYGVPAGPLAEKLAALTGGEAEAAAQHLAVYLGEKFSQG
jgi:hypothetical protein